MLRLISVILLLSVPMMAATWEEAAEESGESGLVAAPGEPGQKTSPPKAQVLLIPDSTTDAVGMYDPNDGTYLGDFIIDDPSGTTYDLQTPINAIPYDGYVFVSDQVSDIVYIFDENGDYYGIAAQTGMNNVRGIDFRSDTLYVTSGDDYVAMFSGPDAFAGYFIQDGTDPFDILFVDEVTSGSALLADIQGTTDNVRHYDADGTLIGELFPVSFPEQVQIDAGNPGYYLCAGFSADSIYRFTIDGTVTDKWYINGPRGVYRLGNGNLLVTDGAGTHEMDASTGAIIETEFSGSCRFIELCDVTVGTADDYVEPVIPGGVSVFPNPFSESLTVSVDLESPGQVTVTVFALDGRIAGTVSPGVLEPGTHVLEWNARGAESGFYFVRVTTPGGVTTEKVQLLR